MRFRILLVAAFGAVSLSGCLATHHVEHCCSSRTTADEHGQTSEEQVTHNERHWLGPWPLQPWRATP